MAKSLATIPADLRKNLTLLNVASTAATLEYCRKNPVSSASFVDGFVDTASPYIALGSKISAESYAETRIASAAITGDSYNDFTAYPRRTPKAISKAYAMGGAGVKLYQEGSDLNLVLNFFGRASEKALFTASRETFADNMLDDVMNPDLGLNPNVGACKYCIIVSLERVRQFNGTFHDSCKCVNQVLFPKIQPGSFVSRKTLNIQEEMRAWQEKHPMAGDEQIFEREKIKEISHIRKQNDKYRSFLENAKNADLSPEQLAKVEKVQVKYDSTRAWLEERYELKKRNAPLWWEGNKE